MPDEVARGDTADLPQDGLEDWSNANNVFQFVRVEDIDYDPDNPRTVYFADTGNSRLVDPGTGRLYRASSGGAFAGGRIFKMVMNANDPTVVDSFSVLLDAASIGMRTPDNVAVSHDTLMVQEDTSSFSKIWAYSLAASTWTHIATGTQGPAETSGIVDVSRWFGDGWWGCRRGSPRTCSRRQRVADRDERRHGGAVDAGEHRCLGRVEPGIRVGARRHGGERRQHRRAQGCDESLRSHATPLRCTRWTGGMILFATLELCARPRNNVRGSRDDGRMRWRIGLSCSASRTRP